MKKGYMPENSLNRRRYALFYWLYYRIGITKSDIARLFGVNHSTVSRGIDKALEYYKTEILVYDTKINIVNDLLNKLYPNNDLTAKEAR